MPGSNNLFIRRSLICAASALALCTVSNPALAQSGQTQQIAIEAQPLSAALIEAGRRYGVTISVSEALTRGKRAPAVSGSLNADQAINRLLAGSGLTFERSRGGYVISQAPTRPSRSQSTTTTSSVTEREQLNTESAPIVVTGSRIERTAFNSPSPIDIVTKEDIEKLGLTDTTEALRFVPALQQSVSLTTPELFGRGAVAGGNEGAAGLAALNLRGLGFERTLVLVNGRRHVAGSQGVATVDVTSIPTALIERVEVLTGGGSSIYGADAVSGVVNYIIKDDFEGVEVSSNYSVPTEGDGEAYFGSVTVGGKFGDGRGNAVLNAEYQRQGNLQAQDRGFLSAFSAIVPNSPDLVASLGVDPAFANTLATDVRGAADPRAGLATVTFLGDDIAALNANLAGMSSIAGVPVLQSVNLATGAITPFDFGVATGTPFFTIGGDGGSIPADPLSDIIPDNERFAINGFADYDLLEGLNVFVEAKFTRSESSNRIFAPINPSDQIILAENPFLPTQIADQFAALTAAGLGPVLVVDSNFTNDIVQQPREATRETFRIVGGFEGSLSEAFNYEISANYGRTDTTNTVNNELLPDRFFASLDVIADPVTGAPICRSDIDPNTPFPASGFPAPALSGFNTFEPGDGSCVPTNLFSEITEEQAAFFLTTTRQIFELEQFVVNGTITGRSDEFFQLPAGGIGYAAGFEYRDERSLFEPDALQVANLGFLSAFFNDQALGGDFDVFEGFAEVNVPILKDVTFAQSLALDASVRVADYSSVGTATSFAFGGVWEPVNDFRVRASFNRAVRAPNITELFVPQGTTPGNTLDPCAAAQIGNGSSFREANCATLIGGIADFNGDLSFIPSSVAITTGGNPDLQEETADTFTVGFAWSPAQIPGLNIVADYYNIDISDAITSGVGDDLIAANCVDAGSLDNAFCDAVTRDPTTGTIVAVTNTALNLSAITGEGIDYQVNYSFDLDSLLGGDSGVFQANIAGTWLLERENVPFADFPETVDVLDQEIGFPEHFINFSLAWNKGPWSATYGFNYQSSQFLTSAFPAVDREAIEADPFLVDQPRTGDAFIHYIGAVYTFNDSVDLSVRVNNLGNREPFLGAPQFQRFQPVSALGRTVQFGVRGRF